MPRDIAPLTNPLEDATPGEQSDVYSLRAAWNQSVETALDRGGWSRLQEIRGQYLEDVIDVVDTTATADGIDWAFLEECIDAYPPGVGDHPCSSILANVVARCVIRTRIREGVDAIPAWALEYLADVTVEDDSEWAWESTAACGWAVGHPEIAVLDRALEQDFPDFPQYWEPDTELDYQVEISDDVHERLLAAIGSSIDPGRLRHFDDSDRFDLERAADEYGLVNA